MKDLLYTLAAVLIIVWAIAYVGFHSGGLIHLLLAVAIVLAIIRLVLGRKANKILK